MCHVARFAIYPSFSESLELIHTPTLGWQAILHHFERSLKRKSTEFVQIFVSVTASSLDGQLFVVLQCWHQVFSINKENSILILFYFSFMRLPASSVSVKYQSIQQHWFRQRHGVSLLSSGVSSVGKNGCDKMNNGRTPSAATLAWLRITWSLAVQCIYLCSNSLNSAPIRFNQISIWIDWTALRRVGRV